MRFLRLLLLCGILSAPAISQTLWERADAALVRGDLDGAERIYTQILSREPDNEAALFGRAEARFYRAHGGELDWDSATRGVAPGALKDALAGYSRVIEINPNHAEAHFSRALCRKVEGDWSGAMADADRAAEIDSEYADEAAALRGTGAFTWVYRAVLIVGVLICAIAVVPFVRVIARVTAAERQKDG